MTVLTDFLTQAWHTISRALAEAGVDAGLHKAPERIAKSAQRRLRAEIRRLAVLLRRLIFLMALQLELAPVKPRAGKNYFETSDGETEAHVTFSLVPVKAGEVPDFLRGPITVPVRGPVPAAPLIARWRAMLETLKHCHRRARCLARTIQRWQAEGQAKPCISLPLDSRRMPATLGLISVGLAAQLNEALKAWPDTG
jgi:hypothetical protein